MRPNNHFISAILSSSFEAKLEIENKIQFIAQPCLFLFVATVCCTPQISVITLNYAADTACMDKIVMKSPHQAFGI